MTPVIQAALAYTACGLSVVPIAADGSKRPLTSWTSYQTKPMADDDIVRLFRPGCGLAVIGGVVSGGLEILDFDHPDAYPRWLKLLRDTDSELATLVEALPLIETPDAGRHLYYRCDITEGNLKLATAAQPFRGPHSGKSKSVIIETRGERGYVLAPPSPPECHATGREYRHLSGLDLANVARITLAERKTLLDVARALDEKPPAPVEQDHQTAPAPASTGQSRPGDDFAARTSWRQILEPHGWTPVGSAAGTDYWRRPGKTTGISATVGGGSSWLYVFSTNAPLLDAGRSYTQFAAYAALNHGDDFRAATRALAAEGYGEQRPARELAPPDEDTPEAQADDDDELAGDDEADPWEDDPDYYAGPLVTPTDDDTTGPLPDVLLTAPEIAAQLPPLDYLVEELGLVAGGGAPHLIAGYGYSGKTLACQALLLSLAAGRPVWEQWRPARPYRVAHVDLEQGHRLTCSRYQRLARGTGVSLPQLGDTLVACVMPADLRLTRAARSRWERIMDGRNLIVVDSLRAASAGSDENSSDVRQHLDLLGELGDVTGCRALLIVHARKPAQDAEGGLYAIRGSSAIYDGADSVLLFGAARGEPISVQHVKARSTGQLAEDLALVVEDVPAEQDTEDQTPGLRIAVRGHELVDEQRATAAQAARDSCARADAERLRQTLRQHPTGLPVRQLVALSGLSVRRFQVAVVTLGDEISTVAGPRGTVIHRLGGGVD